MFMPPPGMSYGQYAQLYGGFPSDTPSISFQPQPSPFARSIRPDRQMGAALMQGPTSFGGRMAAPGTDMATGRPMNPALFSFNPDPRFSSPVIRRPIPRPSRPFQKPDIDPFAGTPLEGTAGIRGEPLPTPGPPPPPQTPPPMPPPISQPPRPFGGNQFGGIGAFFNQLAMMSPEQYSMGMDRFGQFRQQFGPSMGGGFGMFNQLAQMTPEQYSMGMDRFSQFNQQFGQMPPRFNQMPPPMTGGPRPNPYGGFPISRPFGGGFGGGFNPYMIDRQTRLASGEIIPAGDGLSIAAFQGNPLQGGGMMGTTNPDGTLSVGAGAMPQPSGMSAPAVQPPDPNQGALFRADAGAPMINTAQSGGGGVF